MLNETFDKESIPEIRAMGETAFYNTLKRDAYGRVLRLDSGESWNVSEDTFKALRKARDFMRLVDMPGLCELARSYGAGRAEGREARARRHGNGFDELADRLEKGDDQAADEIEKTLSKIESHMLMTTGTTVRDDVMGAVPNVPAFLTGSPMNMRTRHSAKTGRGPISLFLETTTSSGFSGRERITRIAAMVSLARALSIHRPLNLWFNVTWGGLGRLTQTSIQIETNPIDVSRIAALCANIETVNSLGSQDSHKIAAAHIAQTGRYWGSWAYDVPILERKFAGEILARVISPGSEVAYLPAGLLSADDLTNPEGWVESMLKKFAPYLYDGTNWEAA
jgi:hypothetical protein